MRALVLGMALLSVGCRKHESAPSAEPGEPGQGAVDPGERTPEPVPRLVRPPPDDLPTQSPEVVLGPCRLIGGAGGDPAVYAAKTPGELAHSGGALLGCYQAESPRVVGQVELTLAVAADGKLEKVEATGSDSKVAACMASALPAAQLPKPPLPVSLECELALLPEHGLAHQALAPGPILRIRGDAVLLDGAPTELGKLALPPGRVLLEPDADTRVSAVLAVLAAPALAGRELGWVVVRGGRRYQLSPVPGNAPAPAVAVLATLDSLWAGAAADHRQIRNQEPGMFDYGALTVTLGQLRGQAPVWYGFHADIATDPKLSYDVLSRTIEATVAAGLVDFRVVPRSALPAAFAGPAGVTQ